jgi:hypothetical protein
MSNERWIASDLSRTIISNGSRASGDAPAYCVPDGSVSGQSTSLQNSSRVAL